MKELEALLTNLAEVYISRTIERLIRENKS